MWYCVKEIESETADIILEITIKYPFIGSKIEVSPLVARPKITVPSSFHTCGHTSCDHRLEVKSKKNVRAKRGFVIFFSLAQFMSFKVLFLEYFKNDVK